MKNIYAACLFLGALLCNATPAAACRLMERPSVESLQNAPVAFIGTVIDDLEEEARDDGRSITFAVQKAIRGVPEGASKISIDLGAWSSCDTNFTLGERWLYLGKHIRDNSLKLETSLGTGVVENIAFVQAQTGAAEAAHSLAHKGEFKPICKDGQERGFVIVLDNGLRAEVFSSAATVLAGDTAGRHPYLAELDAYDPMADFIQNLPGTYPDYMVPLDRQAKAWSGRLDICKEKENCTPVDGGRLRLGEVSEAVVAGRIFLHRKPPFSSAYVFRVTRQEKDNCK